MKKKGALKETFEKCPLLPNLCVRLKFQSSKYSIYFCGLKFSPFLTLNKIEHFLKVSKRGALFPDPFCSLIYMRNYYA
jgi:hypothetical protein